MSRLIDLTGNVFYRLTVIKLVDRDTRGQPRWLCKCECGNEKVIQGKSLRHNLTKSCGCLVIEAFKTHGMCNSPTYKSWSSMLSRCTNKNTPGWEYYGGRGINVCNEWKDFNLFLRDMGERPSIKFSLDRINNNLGYYKENCKWVEKSTQMRNTRRNVNFEYDGKIVCLTDLSERLGIKRATLNKRLLSGWSFEKAIETPVNLSFRNKKAKLMADLAALIE